MSKKYASKSGDSASAAEDASSYPVLRVCQTANSGPPPPGGKGYHPATAVKLAAAHRWVSYRTFISFLHILMERDFDRALVSSGLRDVVVSLGVGLPVPFAVSRRFPDEEVYVCVDHAPVGSLMVRLIAALQERASRQFYDVVCLMMDAVTGEDSTRSRGLPALYNRCIFESVFQLQWRD